MISNRPPEVHDDTTDNILDDYPVLPVQQVDASYTRVKRWFGVGLVLVIIILILL